MRMIPPIGSMLFVFSGYSRADRQYFAVRNFSGAAWSGLSGSNAIPLPGPAAQRKNLDLVKWL